jgi:hypothetical protein
MHCCGSEMRQTDILRIKILLDRFKLPSSRAILTFCKKIRNKAGRLIFSITFADMSVIRAGGLIRTLAVEDVDGPRPMEAAWTREAGAAGTSPSAAADRIPCVFLGISGSRLPTRPFDFSLAVLNVGIEGLDFFFFFLTMAARPKFPCDDRTKFPFRCARDDLFLVSRSVENFFRF